MKSLPVFPQNPLQRDAFPRALTIGARLCWLSIAALAVVPFIASIPAYYQQAMMLTAPEPFDAYNQRMQPELLSVALQHLGLPQQWFALYVTALLLTAGLIYITIGTLIFFRRSYEPIALAMSLWLVVFGTTSTPLGAALQHEASLLTELNGILGSTAYISFFLLFYFFPDGRLVPRWARWAAMTFIIVIGLDTLFPDADFNPENWGALSIPVHLGLIGSMLYTQVYRYRHISTPLQRQQTKWVVFSLVMALLVFLSVGWLGTTLPIRTLPMANLLYNLLGATAGSVAFILIPLAIAIAILQHRLWDIDLIINRALVYGLLTGCVIGIYVLLVGSFGMLFRIQSNMMISLVATGAVAVLFAPLRDRLQRAINRLMYGERDEPYAVLAKLGQQLELTLEPEAVLPTILRTLRTALKVPYAAITLEQGDIELTAAAGTATTDTLALPLLHEGQALGALHVGHREGQRRFSQVDRRLVEDLSRQVSVAARAILLREEALRLAADLQRSRQHLIAAREEERRRLRRDLHDGLGPALASQGLILDAARQLLQHNPGAAEELLDELSRHMQAAISDIRRVVYGLRPPALDELGLVGALREQAHRFGHRGAKMTVTAAQNLPPLPAAVEVAAYCIALEAMTNVVRHAQASICSVDLHVASGGERHLLMLEVTDNGRGLPERFEAGVGLHAMRERAAELGGRFVLETRPQGGTRICTFLPLEEEP